MGQYEQNQWRSEELMNTRELNEQLTQKLEKQQVKLDNIWVSIQKVRNGGQSQAMSLEEISNEIGWRW